VTEEVQYKLTELPDSPGCYLMKSRGKVIYVGKAKNLKNRVRTYFHSNINNTAKVQAMVEKVDDFDIVLVDGELEALSLECNLIKLYRPYYNIRLKDDKHYPYIRVDMTEPFPRVDLIRRPVKDHARYFGPYSGATMVREVMDVVRLVFPIRTCNRIIQPEKPVRPCVQHEIGQCLAPCAGKVNSEDYHALMKKVLEFLGGDDKPLLKELDERMREAALSLNYERASVYRDRIRAVEELTQKQKAIVAGGGDQDVLAFMAGSDDAVVQAITIRGGKMIGSESHLMERAGDEPANEVLLSFILQYYGEDEPPPRDILASDEPRERETLAALLSELRESKVYISVPKRGEKKELMDMALKNAANFTEKREARLKQSYARTTGALEELKDILDLSGPPARIEAFDISNTQGAQSVGSMVVMKDGKSSNRDYRRFRIKTVEGPNDFASMREIIFRRFKHGLQEAEERETEGLPAEGGKFSELPDLVLIDGGKGQLNAALSAMEELGVKIPAFGLAKRIEEIVLPDGEESILLERHSAALHLIQRLRDEAHRFAITHHRSLRGKAAVKSRLEEIPGVGPARRKALLTHFPTIEALEAASPEEIARVPGVPINVAREILNFLKPQDLEKS